MRVFIKVIFGIVLMYLAVEWVLAPIILTYGWTESAKEQVTALRFSPEDLRKWYFFRKGLYVTRLCWVQAKVSLFLFLCYMIASGWCLIASLSNCRRWSKVINNKLGIQVKCSERTDSSILLEHKSWTWNRITHVVVILVICVTFIAIRSVSNRCKTYHYKANESFMVLYESARVHPENLNDTDFFPLWESLLNDIYLLRKNMKTLIEYELMFYVLYIIALTILWKNWRGQGRRTLGPKRGHTESAV